jgi:hypothetical protein
MERFERPALGDVIVLGAVTLIGFATHGEAGLPFLPRILATFLPLTAGWFLLAPWFGLFGRAVSADPRQLWRPAWAMLLAAPLAATLRGLVLQAPILPVFVLVLGLSCALGLTGWRILLYALIRRAGK